MIYSSGIGGLADVDHLEMLTAPLVFPSKLYLLLEISDKSVISWLPDGKSFQIRDMTKFTTTILPLHFKRKNHSI